MGQALRRAAGKARPGSSIETTSSSIPKTIVNKPPPVTPPEPPPEITKPGEEGFDSDGGAGEAAPNAENLLEERDPKFDSMLNQMVGRIKSKPGGKPEMGEAHVVEKYKRPLPKLRDTKPDSGRFEERAAPPGTLNVAQLRHIILLHQGKAEDHNGPMEVQRIADKFRVDVAEVKRIVQFVSLPPEDTSKQKKNP
ncbi:hypothetical protein RchiOBHm_Chr4g0421971 [Rosa chinensis]|uniref:Uncharacterized protein n=1 Tax=Rosa chinensis TaxID=74649 RepID=A0A2P6QY86_ROSCH|nr:uncharacterized protein LOC112200167 [Rosa chinensis]PRQ39158.1 hypothetical protein RchiOBHm_Chr4g0421971 [Rosa chinensis]